MIDTEEVIIPISTGGKERLDFWLKMTSDFFSSAFKEELKSKKTGLDYEAYFLLDCLNKEDGLTRRRLSEDLQKSKNKISKITSRLIQKELISLRRTGGKRTYELTVLGKEKHAEISLLLWETLQKALKNISFDDLEITIGVLKRVFMNLQLQKQQN